MARGIRQAGDIVTVRDEALYPGEPDLNSDIAVFYGLEGNMRQIFKDHRRNFAAVYVDLGYWGRREGGRWAGYHKVVVDARHPTAYYRKPQHDFSRLLHFASLQPAPWRKAGHHILVAGMGDKGAIAEGYQPEQWERWAIGQLQQHTRRPIVYRPKPSWKTARPIPGTIYSPRDRDAELELQNCWAVVTHHSNVAVDALVAGVPVFCWEGVAAALGSTDLSQIESPPMPDGRDEWMADIAWTQWSVREMADGLAWRHLRLEGLV